LFDAGGAFHGAHGLIAGFGPGITAEITLGTWCGHPERPAPRTDHLISKEAMT
jgi:1,3,6,8-tetrahydroxynaphthalene synthase